MQSTMMQNQASVQTIFRHGETLNGSSRIFGFDGTRVSESSFATVAERARRLAGALQSIGVNPEDRVATFCVNHQAHLEAFLAVPCMGAVLHTLNTRLFASQLAYIVDEFQDRILIIDSSLLRVIEPVLAQSPSIEAMIVIGACDVDTLGGRPVIPYEDLLARVAPVAAWPALDESAAAVACYTSGTTGNPKGIVYGHRSIFMHSLASMGVDTFAISRRDRILLLPPMFHSNAWGLPYTAWFAGSDLILPGPHVQAGSTRFLVETLRPTFTALVPTLIGDLLAANADQPIDMSCFRVLVSGGSPVPAPLIDRVRRTWGVPVLQGWGMTETSPLCALSLPPPACPVEDEVAWRAKSGRPVPGMMVRLRDDEGQDVPWDGVARGELQLSGPWVTGAYFGGRSPSSFTGDGWLRTGDVGSIDPEGYVEIKDRAKDVIKSGGEWISSVELEGLLLEHEGVAEAAVIAIADPRWDERPLAIVKLKSGSDVELQELQSRLHGRTARFWIPDYWAFVDSLPRTSVGKIDKLALRDLLLQGSLKVARIPIGDRALV